jgi:hypothetical protein
MAKGSLAGGVSSSATASMGVSLGAGAGGVLKSASGPNTCDLEVEREVEDDEVLRLKSKAGLAAGAGAGICDWTGAALMGAGDKLGGGGAGTAAFGGAFAVAAGMTVVLLETGSLPAAGTSTTSVHFGQRAFLPAYFASTLNFVAQAVQRQRTSAMINHPRDRGPTGLRDELRHYQPSPLGPQDFPPVSGNASGKTRNFLLDLAILKCDICLTSSNTQSTASAPYDPLA